MEGIFLVAIGRFLTAAVVEGKTCVLVTAASVEGFLADLAFSVYQNCVRATGARLKTW